MVYALDFHGSASSVSENAQLATVWHCGLAQPAVKEPEQLAGLIKGAVINPGDILKSRALTVGPCA